MRDGVARETRQHRNSSGRPRLHRRSPSAVRSTSSDTNRRWLHNHTHVMRPTIAVARVTDPRVQRTSSVTRQATARVVKSQQADLMSLPSRSTTMTKVTTHTAAAILTAISIMAGAIGAAQAHHSTAHSIGTQPNSAPDQWRPMPTAAVQISCGASTPPGEMSRRRSHQILTAVGCMMKPAAARAARSGGEG